MNADSLIAAAAVFLGSAALAMGNETLETNFRTNGPRMHQLLSEGATKAALQQSSAVVQKGRVGQRGYEEIAFGVVVSPDGYILTKASEVPSIEGVVVTIDQQMYKEVKLITTDPRWDVALLKVEATGLTPARLSESSDPERGTWVVANGSTTRKDRNPQVGVISANAREVKEKSGMILGVAFDEEDGQLAISDIDPEGDGKNAGLEVGDVFVSVADHPVKDGRSLIEALEGHKVGESVTVQVKREDETQAFSVPLGEMLTRNDSMSGDNRSVRRSNFPRVIQHDIIADRERMGGPVFDLDGNCLGMNIARADRCETYAIPATELKTLIADLIAKAPAP